MKCVSGKSLKCASEGRDAWQGMCSNCKDLEGLEDRIKAQIKAKQDHDNDLLEERRFRSELVEMNMHGV